MAAGNFQKCLAFVLKYEGGSSDDTRDPGGHKKEGITQKAYDCFLDKKGLPHKDVCDIPDSERDEIYRTEYWNAVNGDALRPGENLCVFDLAVNSGPHRALQIWNQAGAAQVTLNDIIKKVCAIRLSFLQELRIWQYFGAGWSLQIGRVENVQLRKFTNAANGGSCRDYRYHRHEYAAAIHYLQNDPHGPVLALVRDIA